MSYDEQLTTEPMTWTERAPGLLAVAVGFAGGLAMIVSVIGRLVAP
ncbi:hypothetical protein [Microbacterium paludicola]|nr:hypothetical protein [Microbacterium paludicola]